MFQLKPNPTFQAEVSVNIPGGANATFKATFKYIPQSELDQLLKANEGQSDAEVVRGVLVGWEGVTDETGQPMTFSEQAVESFNQIPYARTATVRTYLKEITGVREGN